MCMLTGVNAERKSTRRCDKGAQISILANKIATLWWHNIVNKESKQTIHYFYFFIFSL